MHTTTIYLIDDDEISNYLSISLIKKVIPDAHVTEFRNGLEALEFFKAQEALRSELNHRRFILLDIRMPVMNGFEFLDEVAVSGTGLKEAVDIIMLTSSDNPRDLEKAQNYEVSGYINKPLSEADLTNYIKKAG